MSTENSLNYVQATERLQTIIDEIQSGAVDVDKLSDLLKEADGLIKFCRAKLYKVDEDVKAILQSMNDDLSGEG